METPVFSDLLYEDNYNMCVYKNRRLNDTDLIIYIYVVCYNEEFIIPHFLKHYHYATKIFIYDNCSTDNTIFIASNDPRCEIIHFSSMFNDTVNQQIKNNCWKYHRDQCDYAIVCDMDEFLWHSNGLYDYLRESKLNKNIIYSILKVNGINMVSTDKSYKASEFLYKQINYGYLDNMYSKSNIFCPSDIISMNYLPGSHACSPYNHANKILIGGAIILLHFKFIGGLKRLEKRQKEYHARLSNENITNNQGLHYLESNSIEKQYNLACKKSVKIYEI